MKFSTFIITAFLAIGVVTADEWHEKKIDHDKVQPYPQRNPTTDIERVAINLKPALLHQFTCYPYPAVNDAGESSAGLKATGDPVAECQGSKLGSQIYARAGEINGLHAIMYMHYFPRSEKHRHDFGTLVVFIADFQLETPSILGCSVSAPTVRGFDNHVPCPAESIINNSILISYETTLKDDNILKLALNRGGLLAPDLTDAYQDLVMWDHMSVFARKALNSSVFDDLQVNISDLHFQESLKRAWSFTDEYDNDFLQ